MNFPPKTKAQTELRAENYKNARLKGSKSNKTSLQPTVQPPNANELKFFGKTERGSIVNTQSDVLRTPAYGNVASCEFSSMFRAGKLDRTI